ncbi:hypothetical protein AZE42_12837 [Rhizopogon vesiculosus]|uniref:Serine/threonine-protein kinase Atg1-like tMIT domain-containing protein n=1 Tax=Rhizopogon vesiculosus TaxID=180088 RepID=A0A1J8QPI8_9AGAM|nr:hypothetical protein AZE42_12837 [Rhizopogon vesiculosus]
MIRFSAICTNTYPPLPPALPSSSSPNLFGATFKSPVSPSAVHYSTSSSLWHPQHILRTPSERKNEIDPIEDELLANLEELAQKTDFLTHWADEMYEYVKAVPQKPLLDSTKFSRQAEYNAVTCIAIYMLLIFLAEGDRQATALSRASTNAPP